GFLWRARQQSNELTKERGLSVIHERTAALRYTQAERGLVDKGVQPWKDEIREVIDHAKQECRNAEDFKAYLQRHGIEINERGSRTERGGKSWTYKHPDGGKVRGAKLGEEYTRSAVTESLSMEKSHETALEQVEQLQGGSSSTLEKALKMADEAGEKEQEKVAALQMEERPDVPDDWKWLSEADKDDLKNDLDHIDDWGLSR
ncbi:MAG: relaxase/mobilization nuclease domain-containing protein, partial [Selenomonas sp.]|nr:relaxase/mobilization nuclease domain-containing protein [Selenomonas sp.]